MRIKQLLGYCFSLLFLLSSYQAVYAVAACIPTDYGPCSGPCGTQWVIYSGTLPGNGGKCPSGQCVTYNCFDEAENCQTPDNDPYAWCPEGHPDVACNKITCDNCNNTGNCIYEKWDNVLCNCSPPPDDGGGGGDDGSGGNGDPPPPGTTTTPPPGVTNTPTPTPVPIIQGRIQSDAGAALSGNYCAQATQVPLTVPGLSLQATGSTGTHQASFGFVNPDFYTINTVSAGSGYTVTLDLSGQPTNPLRFERFAHSHFGDFENTPIRHLLRQLQFRPTA